MQGGLTFTHGKIALAEVLDRMAAGNCLNIDNP
jgi:cystathionine beta-lyase family protein involved in aluminum resistance